MSPFKQFTEKSLTCFFRVGSAGSEISKINSIPINPSAPFSSDGDHHRHECSTWLLSGSFTRHVRSTGPQIQFRRTTEQFRFQSTPTDRPKLDNESSRDSCPRPPSRERTNNLKSHSIFFIALLVATNNSNYPRAKKILSPVTFNFFVRLVRGFFHSKLKNRIKLYEKKNEFTSHPKAEKERKTRWRLERNQFKRQ